MKMGERYFWSGLRRNGDVGELPGIKIFAGEELPPIDKADMIRITILKDRPSDKLEESEFWIYWWIDSARAKLWTECRANDERFKKQYKEKPEFAEKIIEFLQHAADTVFRREEARNLKVGEFLDESLVPEYLKPFFSDVKGWNEFLKPIREKNWFNFHYGAGVTDDGWYQFVTNWYHVKSKEEMSIVEEDIIMFNPQASPTVENWCVWWKLPAKKIIVIVPHDSSDKDFAEHFGYSEVYQQYLDNKKRKEDGEEKRFKEFCERSDKERQQTKQGLRNVLLS